MLNINFKYNIMERIYDKILQKISLNQLFKLIILYILYITE